MSKIQVVKGDDSPIYKFKRTDKNGDIKTMPKKMWITFKINPNIKEFIIQKTLESGIEFSEEDYFYRFKLESEDTENINGGVYGFDIAIINESGEKKTLLNDGCLEILEHYTHKENEG